MPAGKLSVTPLTINGLAQNGYTTSQTFIGCYVSQAEKHRTNSASGPEPHFQDTLKCSVGDHDETLYLDVVNEDPSHPGLIGSAQLPLDSVFGSGSFENWVPLVATTGQPLGHIYIRLAFTSSHEFVPSYAAPPSYEQKTEAGPYNTEAPHSPIPDSQQRASYDQNNGPPSYASPQSYNAGSPSPYAAAGAAGIAGAAGASSSYGSNNTYAPVTGSAPVSGNAPVATTTKPKKNIPGWMKYGGAALAGAAAVGLGSWAVDALGSDDEEDKEEQEKKALEQQQEAYHAQQEQQRSFNQEQEEIYEQRKKEEEELYQKRLEEEQERYEERVKEEEERREEEEERYQERLEEEEERREEEEEERREEEEERREEEEEEREEEECEEEYHDREIQPERPVANDSKWR